MPKERIRLVAKGDHVHAIDKKNGIVAVYDVDFYRADNEIPYGVAQQVADTMAQMLLHFTPDEIKITLDVIRA